MKTYKLNENIRVQAAVEGCPTPDEVSTPKSKKLLVDMNCAADVLVVAKKIDMLVVDIVAGGMMSEMPPGERFGLFDVSPEVEGEFRRLAGQQGLTVLEVQG